MKITKWVDVGAEVEVEIGMEDIRAALAEKLDEVTRDQLDAGAMPNIHDITGSFNCIGAFLKALTDKHIAMLNDSQRKVVGSYLADASMRFLAPKQPT